MAQVAAADMRDITLLKDEAGGLMMEEGIASITFYKGEFQPAVEALRAQFALAVASNPWMAGRLVKGKAGTCLRHPPTPSPTDIDALFTATAAGDEAAFKLSPFSPYIKTCTDMYASKKVIVGSGRASVGKDAPVTLLTLSESAPGEFALIFSMSHAIADGRTYYEIMQMLQPGAAVRELQSERIPAFSESMRDMCGRKELEWADSPGVICMFVCGMLPCCSGPKPQCFAFELDPERLAEAKSAAAQDGSVEYVTTNDILTSGFFSECDCRIGMMGIDCRGRVEGIGQDQAGNYVSALVLDPDTFATPAAVRKMLSSTPYKTTMRPLPGCCSAVCPCGKESSKFGVSA